MIPGTERACLAIRFVLSDAYTAMAKEERQSLLHEGVSVAQTMSAYGMHLLHSLDFYMIILLRID